jgi:MFS family permease
MIRTARRPPCRRRSPQSRLDSEPKAREASFTYGRSFWLAYVSNSLITVAIALLYRYADFVTLLGGTEFHLGWIVGVGMVGSLLMRLALGNYIDRYGTKFIWLGCTVLFVVVCFAHLAISSYTGVTIYLLRILYCSAMAGIFGASMTFISARAPSQRMGELVGMLGTAGFLGIVVGTLLGDYLLGSLKADHGQVAWMFITAGLIGAISFPFAWLAVQTECRPKTVAPQSLWSLLRRHRPGTILLVGIAMGLGLGLPQTFLRTYAAQLAIPRIGLFFLVYCAAAVITRVVTRRWPERFGTRRIILLGLGGIAVSLVLFLPVRAEWLLMVPAITYGCSHAILFPSVVAAGGLAFPAHNRGLATVLVLAANDVGQLVGAPTAGAALQYSECFGLPPYPTMFLLMAGLLTAVGLCYASLTRVSVAPVGQAPHA